MNSARQERVLIVDDDDDVAKVLQAALTQEEIAAQFVTSSAGAISALEHGLFDVVLTDVQMPGLSGMQLLATLQQRWPQVIVILITAHGTVRMAVEAIKDGAVDVLTKPFDLDEVIATVRRALALSHDQCRKPSPAAESSGVLDTRSPAMIEAERILLRAAASDCTVLLLGESGTGKEVAARVVHRMSSRATKPFVALHCAALPDSLLASELFGHERGAFTGAVARKPGRLELAEGGTLFLDEIGEMSPATQVKLLRVLQERTFERLGGVSTLKANVRFVAATHRDVAAMVDAGQFREDLYYRLNVCTVRLPPLRERREDIMPLAEHFAAMHGRRAVVFDREARAFLESHSWPGNVRQLQNMIERSLLFCEGPEIGRRALIDDEARHLSSAPGAPVVVDAVTLDVKRRDTERAAVKHALERSGGNRTEAARLLGVSRRTLYNKLAEYGLE